ncbi:MAG: TIGR03084 family metal-binding protein [Acidimicrobiales bacterium]
MTDLDALRVDLAGEHAWLDDLVAGIDDHAWATPTPAAGWDVADQIGHLAYFDHQATTAIESPDRFTEGLAELARAMDASTIDDYTLAPTRALDRPGLLAYWRRARARLLDAAAGLAPGDRVVWYGPSMSSASFLTARLMETWAHGVDVATALGVAPSSSDRLRHVARLGYLTRGWSYTVRGEAVPPGTVRVDLVAPSGAAWSFGDDPADDVVTGPALDFCLVVTQRRHVDDTELASGELGHDWLTRAQAYAGGPTLGPNPKGRDVTR